MEKDFTEEHKYLLAKKRVEKIKQKNSIKINCPICNALIRKSLSEMWSSTVTIALVEDNISTTSAESHSNPYLNSYPRRSKSDTWSQDSTIPDLLAANLKFSMINSIRCLEK